MSDVREELKYTNNHEWVRDDGDGLVTIGITDHAQESLGDLVFVELPETGPIEAGSGCAVVESVKAASDVYAPVSGEIVETNDELADQPELINSDPYGEGWMMRVRLADGAALGELLDAEGYRNSLAEED